jgi:two-component sensor histidine kinase
MAGKQWKKRAQAARGGSHRSTDSADLPASRESVVRELLRTRPGRVALAALGWTLLGCVFALPDLSAGGGRRHALLLSLTLWWSWGLVTPLILWVDRQIPVSRKQLARRVLAHFLPSLLVTAVYVYVLGAVRAAFGIGEWKDLPTIGFLVHGRGLVLWNWLIYWLILGAWQAYRYYDHYIAAELRLERLEKNFSEARLNALRMQLDPHFLFNALNTISSQVERDPKLARRMIEHLGDLLRLSLESKNRQEVPLAEELAFLEHYLAIQKIRFGDHLRIETQIAPDVKYASVPFLFVQPLVENAIRHGISRRASGGTVIVSAQRDGNRLEIRVIDDGVGLPAGWTLENSGGVGLSVTRQRVAGLYPNGETCFAVKRRASGGAEVEISLPLRWNGRDAHAAVGH